MTPLRKARFVFKKRITPLRKANKFEENQHYVKQNSFLKKE